MPNKSLQQRLEEARASSPLNDLTNHEIATKIAGVLKRGVTPNLSEDGRKRIAEGNRKKNASAEWREKVRKANNNWSEERRAAYENRDMSYVDDPAYRQKLKDHNAKNRNPVMVQKLNKDWVEYESIRAADIALGANGKIQNNPGFYFPKDGSLKEIKHKMSPWYGYKLQRKNK